tara:strand:- start:12 stop:842 length:831 start_codon:yes stop_codon:yes gene_type:complete
MLYYILFIIIILILTFLFINNKKFININNNIILIIKNYTKNINKNEYKFRYNRVNNLIENIYINGIKKFYIYDKYKLNYLIYKTNKKLIKFKKFKKDIEWNLIKLDSNIDYGMPFTLKNLIFIPDTLNIGYTTLLHEQIHIHQRKHLKLYKKLYENLGFTKLQDNTLYNEFIKRNNIIILTNPDGLDIYNYNINNIIYIPILIIQNNYPKEILINTNNTNNINEWKLDEIFYKNIYNINSSLYHPNEITAESICEYILNNTKIHPLILDFIKNNYI